MTFALESDGTVTGWGDNSLGELAIPAGLHDVVAVAAGAGQSMALQADGTVAAWGANGDGQCAAPPGLTNVVALAGGGAHSLALKSDGSAAAWGANWDGQCALAPDLSDVAGISAGAAHSLVLIESTLPDPRLLNPTVRSNRFSALLQTLNRRHYALEYAASLTTSQWNGITTNAGNGALEILADPSATAPQRFYRMRQW